jgi:hypothetical protein
MTDEDTKIEGDRMVLCQACLAVSEYTDAKNNEDEFCQCGGQWCGCDWCNIAIARLRAGERQRDRVHTQVDIDFWCEATGIYPPPEPPAPTAS